MPLVANSEGGNPAVEKQLQRLLKHNKRLLDLPTLEQVVAVRVALRDGDEAFAKQLWNELSIEERLDLYIRESKGSVIPKDEQQILEPHK